MCQDLFVTLAPTLRPPAHLVSRRAIAYWTVRALPPWLILIVAQVIWLAVDAQTWLYVSLGVTVAMALIHLIVMPQWRYRVHRWETSADAVYTQSGWFNQERRIAPISRIQTVDSQRGPFEQLFGLANVTVTTASAAGPLYIHGLDLHVAQQLVHELTTITQATEGDAT
jgi:membrane protein YdbS with pleckstrin-like domain